MEAILGAVTDIITLVGDVFTAMTSNPLLLAFLGASLLGVGIGVFRKLRRAATH